MSNIASDLGPPSGPAVEKRPGHAPHYGRGYAPSNAATPYIIAVGIVVLSIGLRMPLDPWLGPTRAVFLVPYCAVIFIAVFYGFIPALLTEILSLIGIVFFVLPPRFTFKTPDAEVQ